MNPSDLSRHRVAAMLACLSTLGALGGLCGAPALAGPVRIAAAPGAAAPLSANDSVRLGTTTFRNLVPLAMLEQQADEQYAYLLAAARLDKHLLNDKQAPLPQVRAIATKLVPYALKWNDRSRQWHWEVNVVRARQIDAFCFPGGKILLTTGMIERLKLSDDEIAMLLGHEIAHALREHRRNGSDCPGWGRNRWP
jgi:Zn-dependent protease with chaperone function